MILFLLKGLPLSILIQIVDEFLYYAHEAERRGSSANSPLTLIPNEVERVNTEFTAPSMRNHWTHPRGLPRAPLAIQARLTKYVRAQPDADPVLLNSNSGRLLLVTLFPVTIPYHSIRNEYGIDRHGVIHNQKVHLSEGRTVWALFFMPCYESNNKDEVTFVVKDVLVEGV
ncbi:hypothetical protein QBC36DRAFT_348591 [Triangularia setosa]|uniref:Uncharacterized protein n=1 Tax=Triangularia setosa TaxID=2587417 RepID=A0AAN6W1W4_9PEZI|nr:hypothetical protein QBC36DRAFT_348591 [Podospora setosa]